MQAGIDATAHFKFIPAKIWFPQRAAVSLIVQQDKFHQSLTCFVQLK